MEQDNDIGKSLPPYRGAQKYSLLENHQISTRSINETINGANLYFNPLDYNYLIPPIIPVSKRTIEYLPMMNADLECDAPITINVPSFYNYDYSLYQNHTMAVNQPISPPESDQGKSSSESPNSCNNNEANETLVEESRFDQKIVDKRSSMFQPQINLNDGEDSSRDNSRYTSKESTPIMQQDNVRRSKDKPKDKEGKRTYRRTKIRDCCVRCGLTDTCKWRKGPDDTSLCNSCGLFYYKALKKGDVKSAQQLLYNSKVIKKKRRDKDS